VKLVREKVVMQEDRVKYSWVPFGSGILGKIEIPSFYESSDGSSCASDLKHALHELKSQGALVGVVLDLRENSGGFLNQAVKVASLFMSGGVVVVSKYAEGQMQYLRNTDGKIFYQGPLLILTSKASASAAELCKIME
jgi:carboxyl-terminal processing protease